MTLDEIEALIEGRRTSLLIDSDRAVEEALVERLCRLALWAPNHKRTWPWRIAAFSGDGRARLGRAFADAQVAAGMTDEPKLEKTRTKYLRAPTVIVVGATGDAIPDLADENRDAVAAGVENLLLGAHAAGLAAYWSTPPARRDPNVLELCGFDAAVTLVAVIYLGWPTGQRPVPERPALALRHVR